MSKTKTTTETIPDTGDRTIEITTPGGQQVIRYVVIDTDGNPHGTTATVAEILAAHPEIDSATFAATLAAFRSYLDTKLGFA